MSDQGEYAAYFAQFFDQVRLYSARRVGWADAEEVTSEVFLQAWRHWPQSRERSLPWLYRTAGLVIRNHRRAHEHQQRILAQAVDVFAAGLGSTGAGPSHGAADAADAVTHRTQACVALARLRPEDREVLLLSAWEGLTARELGQTLGCSTAAAYVRLHRARRRLEDLLADPDLTPLAQSVPTTSGKDR